MPLFAEPAIREGHAEDRGLDGLPRRLNGAFVAIGPARGPHGYYRVDVLDVSPHREPGRTCWPSKWPATTSTATTCWISPRFCRRRSSPRGEFWPPPGRERGISSAVIPDTRVQKVQRYSFQRPFIEVYRLSPRSMPGVTARRAAGPGGAGRGARQAAVAAPRAAAAVRDPQPLRRSSWTGRPTARQPENLWKDRRWSTSDRSSRAIRKTNWRPSRRWRSRRSSPAGPPLAAAYEPDGRIALAAGEYRILDLGTNLTGFVGGTIECAEKSRVLVRVRRDPDGRGCRFQTPGCVNLVSYELEPGTYAVESIEPYTLRYLKLICVEGACTVSNVHLREYKHPQPDQATFECSDPQLNKLYRAGIETFRQNALDVFMDCPSRERAGWLCDSYFTSRVARDVTGTRRWNRTSSRTSCCRSGSSTCRPACSPCAIRPITTTACSSPTGPSGSWCSWRSTCSAAAIGRRWTRLQRQGLKLFEYFEAYENSDGLLEKLPGWVFVEWSKANEFVQDVNYPSNMLYAGALAAAGRMYNLPELCAKAEKIRDVVRHQSFDGQFFVDNAMRTDGKLQVTKNRSEVCQYFAFFFDVASPRRTGAVERAARAIRPESQADQGSLGRPRRQFVHRQHAAIRTAVPVRLPATDSGRVDRLPAVHGRADRHVVGKRWRLCQLQPRLRLAHRPHAVSRRAGNRPGRHAAEDRPPALADVRLDWCRGSLPTPDGLVRLRWEDAGTNWLYSVQVPDGYEVDVETPAAGADRAVHRLIADYSPRRHGDTGNPV